MSTGVVARRWERRLCCPDSDVLKEGEGLEGAVSVVEEPRDARGSKAGWVSSTADDGEEMGWKEVELVDSPD